MKNLIESKKKIINFIVSISLKNTYYLFKILKYLLYQLEKILNKEKNYYHTFLILSNLLLMLFIFFVVCNLPLRYFENFNHIYYLIVLFILFNIFFLKK